MNFKFFKKSKIVLTGLIALLGVTSISSCSSFFGADYTISNVEQRTDQTTGDTIVTITFENEDINPLTLRIPTVTDGIGIESIVPTTENDKVIFTITYTNNDTQVFEVPIVNGTDGVGVEDVVIGEDDEGNPTIEFLYTDGETSGEIPLPRGRDGVGIVSVEPTLTENGTTTYTMTFTDGREPFKFTVSNGVGIKNVELDSETNEDYYVLNIYFTDGTDTFINLPKPVTKQMLSGTEDPGESIGKDGDFYINTYTGYFFEKVNGVWERRFSMKSNDDAKSHTITFTLNEGESCIYNGKEITENTMFYAFATHNTRISANDIPIPTKKGYEFLGWYSDPTNVNSGQFTDLTLITSDLSLSAKWAAL